jgi:SAP domain
VPPVEPSKLNETAAAAAAAAATVTLDDSTEFNTMEEVGAVRTSAPPNAKSANVAVESLTAAAAAAATVPLSFGLASITSDAAPSTSTARQPDTVATTTTTALPVDSAETAIDETVAETTNAVPSIQSDIEATSLPFKDDTAGMANPPQAVETTASLGLDSTLTNATTVTDSSILWPTEMEDKQLLSDSIPTTAVTPSGTETEGTPTLGLDAPTSLTPPAMESGSGTFPHASLDNATMATSTISGGMTESADAVTDSAPESTNLSPTNVVLAERSTLQPDIETDSDAPEEGETVASMGTDAVPRAATSESSLGARRLTGTDKTVVPPAFGLDSLASSSLTAVEAPSATLETLNVNDSMDTVLTTDPAMDSLPAVSDAAREKAVQTDGANRSLDPSKSDAEEATWTSTDDPNKVDSATTALQSEPLDIQPGAETIQETMVDDEKPLNASSSSSPDGEWKVDYSGDVVETTEAPFQVDDEPSGFLNLDLSPVLDTEIDDQLVVVTTSTVDTHAPPTKTIEETSVDEPAFVLDKNVVPPAFGLGSLASLTRREVEVPGAVSETLDAKVSEDALLSTDAVLDSLSTETNAASAATVQTNVANESLDPSVSNLSVNTSEDALLTTDAVLDSVTAEPGADIGRVQTGSANRMLDPPESNLNANISEDALLTTEVLDSQPTEPGWNIAGGSLDALEANAEEAVLKSLDDPVKDDGESFATVATELTSAKLRIQPEASTRQVLVVDDVPLTADTESSDSDTDIPVALEPPSDAARIANLETEADGTAQEIVPEASTDAEATDATIEPSSLIATEDITEVTTAPSVVNDDSALSDEAWIASIEAAQKSIDDSIADLELEDGIVTNDEREKWESAKNLAESLKKWTSSSIPSVPESESDVDASGEMKGASSMPVVSAGEQHEDRETLTAFSNSDINVAGISAPESLTRDWDACTVSELKAELERRGLAKSGKKATLVARLEQSDATAFSEQIESAEVSASDTVDPTAEPAPRDWTYLKTSDLKAELAKRGLSSLGRKAELVAALEKSDLELARSAAQDASAELDSFTLDSSERSREGTIDSYDDEDDFDLFELDMDRDFADVNSAEDVDVDDDTDLDFFDSGASLVVDNDEFGLDSVDDPSENSSFDKAGFDDIEELASAAREAVALFEASNSLPSAGSTTSISSLPQTSLRDWSKLTISQLRGEAKTRGLSTLGSKIELIAELEAFDLEEMNKNRFNDDSDEIDESLDDFDFNFDELDLESLGKAAREAVLLFENDDEPSDEALWAIENEIDQEGPISLSAEDLNLTEEPLPAAIPTIDYASMAVSQLKEELNRRGLRVTGKKLELIARLQASDAEMGSSF